MTSRTWKICILVFASFFLLATNAMATIMFTVDTTDDGVDDNPGNGICHTAAGTCTLRAATMEANRTSGAGATIQLPAGTYLLMIGAHDADGEDNGDLNLSVPLGYSPGPTTIAGAGAGTTIIDAQQIDRVLTVDAFRTVSITGVTLRNGLSTGDGGGIHNEGGLTLTGCVVSDNAADSGGGGIATFSALTLEQSTSSGNTASFGGGIFIGIHDATGTLIQSTVSGNSAAGNGGGIYVGGARIDGTPKGSLSQSSVFGNSAHDSGGGIYVSDSPLMVINSTIALNNADADGGGIYDLNDVDTNVDIYSSTIAYNDADHDRNGGSGGGIFVDSTGGNGINVYNTLVGGNTMGNQPLYDDCDTFGGGTLKTHARNLFGTTDGCTIDQISGSYTTLNSLAYLGGLQNNGGPTKTVALLAGSNAIEGTTGCNDSLSQPIPVDQRGYPRTGLCDVGAFEYDGIFIDGFQENGT